MCGGNIFSLKKLLASAAIFGLAATATPAFAAQGQGSASVDLVTPLSFISVEDLEFGRIISSNQAGTVTMDPSGNRTATNGIQLIGTDNQPASFAGQGTFNQRVDISLGSNTIFLTGPGPAMRVRTFTIGSTPTAVLSTNPRRFRIASANGIFQFPVGAVLEVGASQPAGSYAGTWTITLEYQ